MRYLVFLTAIALAGCSEAKADRGDFPVRVLTSMPWASFTFTDPVYRLVDHENGVACYITGHKHAISCVPIKGNGAHLP